VPHPSRRCCAKGGKKEERLRRTSGGLIGEQMDMLGHDDITKDFQLIAAASQFERVEERVLGGRRDEIRLAAVATEGNKVMVDLPLISFVDIV